MPSNPFAKMGDVSGEYGLSPIFLGSRTGRRLKELGMSDAGIRQLSAGQPILNKNDLKIVNRIVVGAIG